MKNIFSTLGKIITALFVISTIAVIIIVLKKIDNTYILKFANFYILLSFLTAIYFAVAITIKIRYMKWKKISKLLIRWTIWSVILWISTVLLIYFIKGELRLTEKIFSSIAIAFGSVFAELIFERKRSSNEL